MRWLLLVFAIGSSVTYGQIKPVVSQRNFNNQANIVRLAPRYASAIRMPEPVSSVILGDPGKFFAEHSDNEPNLVLVKPVVDDPAESNLLFTPQMAARSALCCAARERIHGRLTSC